MELIDKAALIKRLEESQVMLARGTGKNTTAAVLGQVIEIIKLEPPVDAVPVVRCKECKYADDHGPSGIYCKHPDGRNMIYCLPDEFCDQGRKVAKAKKRSDFYPGADEDGMVLFTGEYCS